MSANNYSHFSLKLLIISLLQLQNLHAAPVAVQRIAAPGTVSPNGLNYTGIDFSSPASSKAGEILFQDSSAGQVAGLPGSLASINLTAANVAGLSLAAGETLVAKPQLTWRGSTPNQYFALATLTTANPSKLALVSGTPGAFTKILRLNETLPGTSATWAATRFSPSFFGQENLPTTSNGDPMIKAVTADDSAAFIGVYRNGAWENTQVVGINAPGFAAGTSLRISGLNVRSGNAAGQFVFDTFTYVNNAPTTNVVYVGQNGSLQLVAKSRDVLAGDSRLLGGSFTSGSINSTGSLVFSGFYTGSLGGFVARWNLSGGAVKMISYGDAIPSIGPRAIFHSPLTFQIPLMNDSGASVFMAEVLLDSRTDSSKRVALLYQPSPGAAVVKLAIDGERINDMPDNLAALLSNSDVYNLNNSGQVALVCSSRANSQASGRTGGFSTIFAGGTAPNLSVVAREDTPLSIDGITGSSTLTGLTRPTAGMTNGYSRVAGQAEAILSEQGEIAFRGTLPGSFFGQSSVFQARLGVAPTATLSAQSIKFPSLFSRAATPGTLTLNATASSGLPVSYTLVSGPATLTGNVVNFSGSAGEVVIRASQAGNSSFLAAEIIDRTISVLSNVGQLPPLGSARASALILPGTTAPGATYSGVDSTDPAILPSGFVTFKDAATNDVVINSGVPIRMNFLSSTTSAVNIPSGEILNSDQAQILNSNASNQALISSFTALAGVIDQSKRVLANGSPGNYTKLLQTGETIPGTTSQFGFVSGPSFGDVPYATRGGLAMVYGDSTNGLASHLGIHRNGAWETTRILGVTPPGFSQTVKFNNLRFMAGNVAGEFLFKSTPTSGSTNLSPSLFYGKNGTLSRIGSSGGTNILSGDARSIASLECKSFNNMGEAALYGSYGSDRSTYGRGGFVYRWTPTTGAAAVLRRGDALTALGANVIFNEPLRPPLINDAGVMIVFASILDSHPTTQALSNPRLALLYQANSTAPIEKILMTGETVAGAPSGFGDLLGGYVQGPSFILHRGISSIQINNSGHIAIFARSGSGSAGYNIVHGGLLPNLNFVMKDGWVDISDVGTKSIVFKSQLNNPFEGVDLVTGEQGAKLDDNGAFVFRANYSNIGTSNSDTGVFQANVVTATPVAVAQTITFASLTDRLVQSSAFNLGATTDSGQPITYQLVSGPATLSGNLLTPGATAGLVTIRATQAGNASFLPATAVERSFRLVANASELAMASYLASSNVPPADRLPLLDLDNDSIVNLMEFALGGNPLIADPQRLPTIEVSEGLLRISYRQAQGGTLIYTVRGTSDFSQIWSNAGINQGIPDPFGFITATIPMVSGGSGFLRLEVEFAP